MILIAFWWLQKLRKDWKYVNKQHKTLIWERFNFRKLNEFEVRKQYQIEISNNFATLEYLNDGQFINKSWENFEEDIKISAKGSLELYEL